MRRLLALMTLVTAALIGGFLLATEASAHGVQVTGNATCADNGWVPHATGTNDNGFGPSQWSGLGELSGPYAEGESRTVDLPLQAFSTTSVTLGPGQVTWTEDGFVLSDVILTIDRPQNCQPSTSSTPPPSTSSSSTPPPSSSSSSSTPPPSSSSSSSTTPPTSSSSTPPSSSSTSPTPPTSSSSDASSTASTSDAPTTSATSSFEAVAVHRSEDGGGGGLADTGAKVTATALIGALALAVGALLTFAGRKRRQH